MSTRTYVSSLPVDITVSTDGTVTVVVNLTDVSEAVYDYNGVEPVPAEGQHMADIRRAVAAKHAGTIVVSVVS